MIPASYLYRTVYDQAWTIAPPAKQEAVVARHKDGLLAPLRSLLASLLAYRGSPARHHHGSFAHG